MRESLAGWLRSCWIITFCGATSSRSTWYCPESSVPHAYSFDDRIKRIPLCLWYLLRLNFSFWALLLEVESTKWKNRKVIRRCIPKSVVKLLISNNVWNRYLFPRSANGMTSTRSIFLKPPCHQALVLVEAFFLLWGCELRNYAIFEGWVHMYR